MQKGQDDKGRNWLLKRLLARPDSKELPIRFSEFMKMSKVCFIGTDETGTNAINALITQAPVGASLSSSEKNRSFW